jgi:hypothetical protein
MYCTPWETLYDPEFCTQEAVDGIQQQQRHYNRRSRKRTSYQHISIFGSCEDVLHFSPHSYNVTINSHNSQLTLHTDSHTSDSGAVRREERAILGDKSKLLCSEIALPRKAFGIGHMCIYTFCLE